MKLLRETIRKILKEQLRDVSPASAFFKDLGSQVDKYSVEFGSDHTFTVNHGECIVYLSAEAPDEEDTSYVHLGYLSVTNNMGNLDPKCFRQGYAGQLLQKVVATADKYGITLGLSAAKNHYTPAYLKKKYGQNIDMPNKEELAKFYARYGFIETDRNAEQIYMTRDAQ